MPTLTEKLSSGNDYLNPDDVAWTEDYITWLNSLSEDELIYAVRMGFSMLAERNFGNGPSTLEGFFTSYIACARAHVDGALKAHALEYPRTLESDLEEDR